MDRFYTFINFLLYKTRYPLWPKTPIITTVDAVLQPANSNIKS